MNSTNINKATLRKADETAVDERIYFHVYNRGVNGQPIFTSDDNFDFLLRRMSEYSPAFGITVIAYCLMPTHYHFLIECENRKQVSRFIQKLFNSYSQAFNQQQGRTGTLFESRAKFKLTKTDEQALQLCSYIHLNPVKAGLVKRPEQWPYSDFAAWVNQSANRESISLRFFETSKEYEDYVFSSLAKG